MPRNIFIGDIHGCYDEFRLLIEKIGITTEDQVYLVGDMINKGPKSYEMLDFIYTHRDQYKAILGNHEDSFLKFYHGEKTKYWGFEQLEQQIQQDARPELIEYLEQLPLYIETDTFLMLHGGLIPGKTLVEHSVDEITRLREYEGQPWHSYYKGKKPIIYGHWAVQGFHRTNNTIGLDSGCVYGGKLTAYILEEDRFVTQDALQQYQNPFQDYKSWTQK